MKKHIRLLGILFCTTLAAAALAACTEKIEYDPTPGLVYTLSDDGSSYLVTGYTGTATEVYIPATYDSRPVSGIGDYAFRDCSSITSITIPDSITSVESNAFYHCDSLQV